MKYIITITKVETTKKEVKDYERLYSAEAYKLVQAEDYQSERKDYGYVTTEKDVEEKTQVFEQVVEDLDIPAVVAVVNKLK